MEVQIPGFEKEEYCCRDWDDIRVPAHIQMEGYDAPQYANVQYPWEGHEDIHPGEIPEHFNPVASYVKYLKCRKKCRGNVSLSPSRGAESGIAFWLNGQFVGYSEDSFTPSEFELTEYVKKVRTNSQHRYSNGQQAAGVRTRTSSVSPEFTEMFTFILYRKFMFMTFRSSRKVRSRMKH